MKKTLSIILSLALLLCAVVVIPAFSVSADTVEFSDYAFDDTLFDSADYLANNHLNSNNEYWLGNGYSDGYGDGNGTKRDITPSGNNQSLVMNSGEITSKILEHNTGVKTNLTNFEWQFNVVSGSNTSAANASLSFLFHVNDGSTIAKDTRLKTLSVTLFGSDYTANYQQPQSLVVEYTMARTNTDGDITGYVTRPYDYDSSGKPKTNSYIDLSDLVLIDKDAGKNLFRDLTINIKLEGRNLTLTVWRIGYEATTKKTLNVRLHGNDHFASTLCGDFAIVNNGTCNMLINSMTIKSDLYDSGKASTSNNTWWDSNTAYVEESGAWKEDINVAGYHANGDAMQLDINGVADRLLATKGFLPTGGVDNFVWGFDYTPGRTWDSRTSFAFHIDDTSVTKGVTTMDGDTVTDFVRPYSARKNMIAVTFCSSLKNPSASELAAGIVIQQADANGNITTLETESGYITKGALAFSEQVASDLKVVNLNEKSGAVFYSVRIVYNEGTVTVYMWKRGDASTMFAVSAEIDESLVPAAGDFSIINFSNLAYLDNMFITSLDGDTTEAEAAVAHYENTYETITGKALCAHDYNGVIVDASTYFVEGSKKLECACGDILATGIKVPVAEDALIKDECKEEFANGNLTITLTYSEDLYKDIDNGAKIYFNYSIDGYNPEPIPILDGYGAEITLEGFNVDRLNAELTYYLTAVYDGVNTEKLAGDTTRTLTVANDVDLDSKTSAFIDALNTEENTVVSADIGATESGNFDKNTITADLKAGTMVLNFIASDALVAKLGENSGLARTNKITVTIDGVANKYEFTPAVMRKSTTINISGMSFEQLNGKVTIKVEFIYEAATEKNISDTIVFEGSAAVAETDTPVANAFADYIAK